MNLRVILAVLCAFTRQAFAVASDPMPVYRIENLPAADGSIQQCLIVRARPGDRIRIESSNDLLHWTPDTTLGPDGTVYSVGQEVTVPIRQFTPPPPPAPGDPPYTFVPCTFVSLQLRPASGPAGGTVVSWPSLENGEALTVRIDGTLGSGWNTVPLAGRRFGDFYYFGWYWNDPAAPPAANPSLSTRDAAMLATFEANLATLNSEVSAQATTIHNTPPPAPAPGNKRWWRAVATPCDTDGDGTYDALEFEMMADSNLSGFAAKNPFHSDENGDGILDGFQSDYDKDGIPDFQDVSQDSDLLAWGTGDPLLFAFFPLTGSGAVRQVNDQGKVLFDHSVWVNGQSLSLNAGNGTTLSGSSAVGIGDNGFILGLGEIDLPGDSGAASSPCYLTWPAAGGNPVALQAGSSYLYPISLPQRGHPNLASFPPPSDMLVNKDGKFVALPATVVSGPGSSGTVLQPGGTSALYQGSTGSGAVTAGSTTPPLTAWISDAGTLGGTDGQGDFRVGTRAFGQLYSRVLTMPDGKQGAFAGYPSLIPFSAQDKELTNPSILKDSAWVAAGTPLSGAVDFSTESKFGILRSGKIWYDKTYGNFDPSIVGVHRFADLAPGLPADWYDITKLAMLDTTRRGWTLASKDGSPVQSMLGLPLFLRTPTPDQGVDVFSATASDDPMFSANQRAGNKNELWVMVPAGGSKQFTIRSAANAITPVTLEAGAGLTVSPTVLSAPEVAVTLSAPAASAGMEIPVALKIGSVSAASIVLKAKVMKPRVVKISLYALKRNAGTAMVSLPPEADVEAYLNELYQPQMNVTFDITYEGEEVLATDPGDEFIVSEPPTFEAKAIATGHANGDIQIFLMVGYRRLRSSDYMQQPDGWTNPTDAWVWMPDYLLRPDTFNLPLLGNTIGHEIGHVLFGPGHPDNNAIPGVAGLPTTNRNIRLMQSGIDLQGEPTKARVIVKGEWDRGNNWLIDNVDTD